MSNPIKVLLEALFDLQFEAIVPLIDILKENQDSRLGDLIKLFGRTTKVICFRNAPTVTRHRSWRMFCNTARDLFWLELNPPDQQFFDTLRQEYEKEIHPLTSEEEDAERPQRELPDDRLRRILREDRAQNQVPLSGVEDVGGEDD